MGRKPCCDKVGLTRGPWSINEDRKLTSFVLSNGIHCWRTVPKLAGLLRCGKSCRLRWINYLRPDLKRGGFTEAEEDEIIQLHAKLGNKWSKIASHFVGRTDNEIKNHWNTKIKKRLKEMGVDVSGDQRKETKKKVVPSSSAPNKAKNAARNQDEEQGLDDQGATNNNKNLVLQDLADNMADEQLDDDDDLLSNYEILNGSCLDQLVIEHWLNDDSTGLDGQSSSASLLPAESLNTNSSTSEFSSLQKQSSGSILQEGDAAYNWFDDMNSFFEFGCLPNDHLHDAHLP